jgi:hypothetical protein
MGIGMKLAAVMALILAVVCGLGYWYYEDQQARMAILQENNAKLTVAVQTNEETIKVMKDHDEQQAKQINELQDGLNKATQDRMDLESKFRNKDIAGMGRKDAKLLEEKINRATQRAFDDLEKTTGLTEQLPINTGAKNAK